MHSCQACTKLCGHSLVRGGSEKGEGHARCGASCCATRGNVVAEWVAARNENLTSLFNHPGARTFLLFLYENLIRASRQLRMWPSHSCGCTWLLHTTQVAACPSAPAPAKWS